MSQKILCVAPYQGLNVLFQQVSQQLLKHEQADDYQFTYIRFDRQDELDTINEILATHYDLIISRGGTATLLRTLTATPVIDIGVSQYDLLNTVQSANRLNHVALVAFSAFSDRAREVFERFNLELKVYGIDSENELSQLLRTLSAQGIDTLICDITTEAAAEDAGFSTLLITASTESVAAALNNGFHLLTQLKAQTTLTNVLGHTLDKLNVMTIIYDTTNQIVFTSQGLARDPRLQQVAINAIHHHHSQFTSGTVRYKLTSDIDGDYTVYTINKWFKPPKNHTTTTSNFLMDESLQAAFSTYFKLIEPPTFFNSLQSYANGNHPLLIIGEVGVGKTYIANLLHQYGLHPQQDPIYIDLSQETAFNNLLEQNDSPLYGTDQCFIFEKTNESNPQVQQTVIDFVLQTRLANRNQVIFTLSQSTDDGLLPALKPLMNLSRIVTLRPFRNIQGDVIVQLLTSLVNTYNRDVGSELLGVSDIALDFILNERWSNNFAQFYHTLNMAMAATGGAYVGIDELRRSLSSDQDHYYLQTHTPPNMNVSTTDTNKTLADMIQDIMIRTLAANQNNRTKTAQQLGISRATLWRYLKHD
ncbi:PrpR N-terminal domain-containing protein [Agrilactobacillus yilanensis]|uniref:PrpR N-terminal domain-containing protein n=1 Tax=Agrilactobacillus yilanensis TaxID=2485997 RepID=A0ABW4J3H4_9LACO|nr:sigma-54-dependent transcriptional regulator [Agrilactobacillus yilanensis]